MATKVQAHCIKIAIKIGKLELACYMALMAGIENGTSVYVPNAYDLVKDAVTPAQWAGYLSSLTKQGKWIPNYEPAYKGFWGNVV